MPSVTAGYSSRSIILHWIGAIAVVALFISHEGSRDSAMFAFHVSGGAILGVLLIWRIARRPLHGFTDKPEQPKLLNLISSLVMWGLLLSLLGVVVTGYLLPWTLGNPLDIYGVVSIPSFMGSVPILHSITERLHNVTGHLIVPLTLLHILGALKHWLYDRDGVMQRMFRSHSGGR